MACVGKMEYIFLHRISYNEVFLTIFGEGNRTNVSLARGQSDQSFQFPENGENTSSHTAEIIQILSFPLSNPLLSFLYPFDTIYSKEMFSMFRRLEA